MHALQEGRALSSARIILVGFPFHVQSDEARSQDLRRQWKILPRVIAHATMCSHSESLEPHVVGLREGDRRS